MKLTKLTMSLAACLSATTALAADLPSRKAPVYVAPVPVMTWTGFHIGVNAGARFGGNTTATTVSGPVFGIPGVGPFQGAINLSSTNSIGIGSRTGAILGVQAGYDLQLYNSFLVGLETDAQGVIGPSTRGLFGNFQPAVGIPFGVQSTGFVTKRLDWLGTTRARVGFTFTPAFLVYGTFGLAYGGVKSNTVITSSVAPGIAGAAISGSTGGYSTNRVGYTVGGGVEYMFSPSFSLKAEYLYYDLGSRIYSAGVSNFNAGAGPTLIAQNAAATRVRFDGHVARIGLNYHFWAPPASAVVARY